MNAHRQSAGMHVANPWRLGLSLLVLIGIVAAAVVLLTQHTQHAQHLTTPLTSANPGVVPPKSSMIPQAVQSIFNATDKAPFVIVTENASSVVAEYDQRDKAFLAKSSGKLLSLERNNTTEDLSMHCSYQTLAVMPLTALESGFIPNTDLTYTVKHTATQTQVHWVEPIANTAPVGAGTATTTQATNSVSGSFIANRAKHIISATIYIERVSHHYQFSYPGQLAIPAISTKRCKIAKPARPTPAARVGKHLGGQSVKH